MKQDTMIDYKNNTILIIDDDAAELRTVANYLEEYDFGVITAGNGKLGLERAKQAKPDLILLDVMMSEMSGFETCLRLKIDDSTKEIPVVFMTDFSELERKITGFEVGAADYISKPIQHEELLVRVVTHLRIRALNRQLQQANQSLRQMNADKDKFFSIVAHDLRGPFGPLLGMIQLLDESAETFTPNDLKMLTSSIHRSANNIFDLLQNLLQWSMLQGGRIEYQPTVINLGEVIEQSITLFVETAKIKGIDLQSNINQEIRIKADENMLFTIIRNLTSNALKFTPKHGKVILTAEPSRSQLRFAEISVADTGVGISLEDLSKLFKIDVSHSTLGTAHEKGSGLGLHLCKDMVEQNGGQIWIESEVGAGTVITFTMPLVT